MDARHPAFLAFSEVLHRAVHPLVPKPETLAWLAEASDVVAVAKGDHLLMAGEVAQHLLFVWRGLLRYYFIDAETSEDWTGQFFVSVVCRVASRNGSGGLRSIRLRRNAGRRPFRRPDQAWPARSRRLRIVMSGCGGATPVAACTPGERSVVRRRVSIIADTFS
jgi:hypothetical protein